MASIRNCNRRLWTLDFYSAHKR